MVEENEAPGAEEVVKLTEENDSRIDSAILNDETTVMVANNSEDVENVRPTTSGENGVGKNENEDNCDAEMGDEDALSEISDIGSQVMEDTYSLEEIKMTFLTQHFLKLLILKSYFQMCKN